jgi:hypothetical protein
MLRKGTDVEVVQDDVADPEHRGRVPGFVGQRVEWEARWQRAVGDRKGNVANVATGVGEQGERAAATQLTVVGVRGEN